jgi:hypothetical protein
MTVQHILDVHGVTNTELAEELEAVIDGRCDSAFQRGIDEGRAAQAMIELQGRERFLASVK